MTKEEVLQKVNDYCTEKQYTDATLTEGFKDKFAEHFVKGNPEADINDEAVLNGMKFALNSAFSSASELATVKTNEFTSKENDLNNQIAELKKKLGKPSKKEIELPEEVAEQLKELQAFKNEKTRQEKLGNIIKIAKKSIRDDLHKSFDSFVSDYEVDDEQDENEQAKYLTGRFQEIFRSSIGDIKPFSPKVDEKKEEEFFENLPKVKVQ